MVTVKVQMRSGYQPVRDISNHRLIGHWLPNSSPCMHPEQLMPVQSLMGTAPLLPKVIEACNYCGRQEALETQLQELEMCEKALQASCNIAVYFYVASGFLLYFSQQWFSIFPLKDKREVHRVQRGTAAGLS